MLIDWFTVAAQFVNFVVLVAILRHFLYGRIIKTVEDREEEIESRLEDAEHRRQEAAQKAQELDQREREWDAKREERLAQTKQETEEKRKELEEEAREKVEELRKRWREALESDKASFLRDLREGVGRRALEIARKAVSDLADEELEDHILRVFRQRFRELGSDQKEALRRAVEQSDGGVTLVSAFEIGKDDRRELTREIGEVLDREVELGFETAPNVICGVELRTEGHKIGFSLGTYMSRLEEWAEEILAAELDERPKRTSRDETHESASA